MFSRPNLPLGADASNTDDHSFFELNGRRNSNLGTATIPQRQTAVVM
jgi:hypothetical protein